MNDCKMVAKVNGAYTQKNTYFIEDNRALFMWLLMQWYNDAAVVEVVGGISK